MKIGTKIPPKIEKIKNISALIQKHSCIEANSSLQGVETATTSSHSLEDWRDLTFSPHLSYTHTSQKATIAMGWERDG
jgi:hypothetical protein